MNNLSAPKSNHEAMWRIEGVLYYWQRCPKNPGMSEAYDDSAVSLIKQLVSWEEKDKYPALLDGLENMAALTEDESIKAGITRVIEYIRSKE